VGDAQVGAGEVALVGYLAVGEGGLEGFEGGDGGGVVFQEGLHEGARAGAAEGEGGGGDHAGGVHGVEVQVAVGGREEVLRVFQTVSRLEGRNIAVVEQTGICGEWLYIQR